LNGWRGPRWKLEHGTPYVWGGNDPFNQTKYNGEMVGPGVDCSGFIVWLFKSVGLIEGDMAADYMWVAWSPYSPGTPFQTGACAFYDKDGNGSASHVMLCIGPGLVIGSCGNAGVCVRPVHYRKDFLGFAAPRG